MRAVLAGFIVAAALGPVAGATAGGEIHIAHRADGRMGTGTKADPFNGSTRERFDRAMRAAPAGATIFLGAGRFLTHGLADGQGTDGFAVKPGQRIVGMGMGRTVLKLARYGARRFHVVIGTPAGVQCDGISIERLTVDGGASGFRLNPLYRPIHGVVLVGARNQLLEVEGLNTYGAHPGAESWTLWLHTRTARSTGNRIVGCVVRSILGDYNNAIAIQGGDFAREGEGALIGGIVEDCLVVGARWNAYATGACDGLVYRRNRAIACGHDFYFDTGPVRDLRVEDNTFEPAPNTISIALYATRGVRDVAIVGNRWTLDGQTPVAIAALVDARFSEGARAEGLTIAGNKVVNHSDGSAGRIFWQQDLPGEAACWRDVRVEGNVSPNCDLAIYEAHRSTEVGWNLVSGAYRRGVATLRMSREMPGTPLWLGPSRAFLVGGEAVVSGPVPVAGEGLEVHAEGRVRGPLTVVARFPDGRVRIRSADPRDTGWISLSPCEESLILDWEE